MQSLKASYRQCGQIFSKTLLLILLLGTAGQALAQELIITGVVDGPLTGGVPKAAEVYVVSNIPDLSIYGLGSANNGGGSDGEEFTFPAVAASAGSFIYVASESTGFTTFFGFAPDYASSALAINGDDAIELFKGGAVVDVFGDINVDGSGQPWEHLDGWAYRADNTGPDGPFFALANWTFSGINALDGETSNATAATPFPIGTYSLSTGDIAPSVQSTSPSNGANFVALDASITINFSEDVTVSGTWFDISCNNSGGHTATVTGGPLSYDLDPDVDFDKGEICDVTIFAAQVVDQDGSPDNMVANNVFSFDVLSDEWVINEIHADPESSIAGDANGDGTRDGSQDEFVEIVNNSGADTDIGGWTVSDAVGVRHTFPPGTMVPADCSIVVFGGGTPNGTFGISLVQTATGGFLGFNNGGDSVTLNNGAGAVASYNYGSEGGSNQSLTRDPDITGAPPLVQHTIASGSGGTLFSPGTLIDGSQFSGCPGEVKIHEVQGNGLSSPLVGQTIAVEGIVVGDFQDGASGTHGDLNGFHVQEEDADADADPSTSEGIFVYDGSSPGTDVKVGDMVRVVGRVSEFNGLTEITSFSGVTVLSAGNPLPAATNVTLPVASLSDFEALESMSVVLPQSLSIAEYFNFDRYGEIVLTTDRLFQPTAIFDPGSPQAAALADLNARSQITLDDGRSSQNPNPALHPNGSVFDLGNLFRGGDLVQNATGVIDYVRGRYRIQPTQDANYTPVNLRTAAHEPVGGGLKVASFNVLNYFTTLDDGPNACGPLLDHGCRGADNATEFTRQRDKIIAAISAIDADVVGLLEIENNINDDAVIDLVTGLNDANGAGTYDYVATGTIGADVIKVALIYQPAAVSLQGGHAILDSSVDPLFNDTKNRPALAQTFVETATGGVLTVAVNHFKSKGSPCDDVGDPNTGDGSGNCNGTRTDAAAALATWLASDPTGSDDADSLVIGDLNSYDKEDPIVALTDAGYTDLAAIFGGEYAYSYVFGGQLGYLDYALASPGLFDQTTGATEWHINADEPDLIDYDTSFKKAAQDAIYAPDAYRSSDHDPVIAGFDLKHYEFKGFSKGVKNPPKVNKAKAGQSVKVKFELKGTDAVDAVADGYPRSQPIACDWSSPGPSEAIVTDGKDKEKQHKKSVKYEYKWLTDSTWKDSCRQLVVLLKDGSYHYANYQFK